MKKTRVFQHRGVIGIQTFSGAPGMVAYPTSTCKQYLFDAKDVEIQHDALFLLKRVEKGHCSVGDIDTYLSVEDDQEMVLFGWLGDQLKMFKPDEITGGEDFNAFLLKGTDNIETPQNFMKTVDMLLLEQAAKSY